ncbi:MAG: hypothetical protein A2X82_18810 [Geobacteraceae bacterium GWC2_55_20]|nr:MAG: hypothetical protein A2X82_18810 [Geobacteraceae bacterium GWC2_55_20]OGU18880.1 MAG: hypothetical protein A2X85_04850 [Geobacteraceae bacterium GWF2_54_21]
MIFNSLLYILFLPVVYIVFYITKDQHRWLVLLLFSYGFYASLNAPHLLLVLILITIISFYCGSVLGRTTDETKRKWVFLAGVTGCILILVIFKYLHIIMPSSFANIYSSLLVSIGISYFIFQSVSYIVDVYMEIHPPEQHFGHYSLYMAFFPKLLQGPIERAGDLLPQLKKPYVFNYDTMRSGMHLFAWGLFKKAIVADRLSLYVNPVYGDVHTYVGLPFILATYAYAMQIFFDFSGYTDMARGTARLFGLSLTENFNSPYLAPSIADFWRRWHISFSRWILDYIFKPLQMSWRNLGQHGSALALLITFFISGIWHGATWGFVLWGVLHGVYLAASTYYRPYQKKLHKWFKLDKSKVLRAWQVLVTFNLVSFSWIFFRMGSVADAWYAIIHMFSGIGNVRAWFFVEGNLELVRTALALFVIVISVIIKHYTRIPQTFYSQPLLARWTCYCVICFLMLCLYVRADSQFIYFKF